MAKIRKINVSEIEGSNPGSNNAILPAGTITVYEDSGEYSLRIHNGQTDGGISFAGEGTGNTGSITFDNVKIIGEATNGFPGLISLVPAQTAVQGDNSINFEDYGQYINIYPTNFFDSPHIHIAAGSGPESDGDLFLGDDDKYVQINNTGNISIRSNDYEGNSGYSWTFKNNGRIELPSGGQIGPYGMGWTGITNGTTGTPLNLAFLSDQEQTLGDELASVYLTGDGGSAQVDITAGTLANSYQWTFDTDGTTTFPDNTIKSSSNLIIQAYSSTGIPTGDVTKITNNQGWDESNVGTNLPTTGGTGTGLTVDVSDGGSFYSVITINTPGTGYTDGDEITVTRPDVSETFTISVPVITSSWEFGSNGEIAFPDGTTNSGGTVIAPGVYNIQSIGNTVIQTSAGAGAKTWDFGTNGNLTFPEGNVQTGAAISITELKALVANAATYAAFQTAIANL